MYDLMEYSLNYSETTGSWRFYFKDEATNFDADVANNNNNNNDNNFKSVEYEAKLLGNTEAERKNGILKNATTAVPLKYLSHFCESLQCYWLISKLN